MAVTPAYASFMAVMAKNKLGNPKKKNREIQDLAIFRSYLLLVAKSIFPVLIVSYSYLRFTIGMLHRSLFQCSGSDNAGQELGGRHNQQTIIADPKKKGTGEYTP